MNGWEITMIVLMAGSVSIALAKHGEPKDGTWSFPITLIATLIQAAILYMAGLWH
jgi:hypothetical protein